MKYIIAVVLAVGIATVALQNRHLTPDERRMVECIDQGWSVSTCTTIVNEGLFSNDSPILPH